MLISWERFLVRAMIHLDLSSLLEELERDARMRKIWRQQSTFIEDSLMAMMLVIAIDAANCTQNDG